MAADYPVALTRLAQWRCVVVGGGAVALRKVVGLVEAGAKPVIISPELEPELSDLVQADQASLVSRAYQDGDLAGAHLVIAATDDRETNERIAEESRRCGALVNVVDAPDLCDFHAPAIVRRGSLTVAVSTGGASPAYARFMRQMLEACIDPAYGELLTLLAELRPRVREAVPRSRQRALYERLLDGALMGRLRAEGTLAAREAALAILADFGAALGQGEG